MVKDKENAIRRLIEQISEIKIEQSPEGRLEEPESEITDEDLQEMSVADIIKASESNTITKKQLYSFAGMKPPEYEKVVIDEERMMLVEVFCRKHDMKLSNDFYFLGNLQKESRFPIFNLLGNSTTSYVGTDSEQEKYKLIENLLRKLREYNHVVEYLGNIDSMLCVSLQVENQGNAFDEDVDIKLFIEKDCFVNVDSIPQPGLFFLGEAVEREAPKFLFRGFRDADVEDFSNYPIVPCIPDPFTYPFRSRDEEIAEQKEKYQKMLEYVFCYDLRENEKADILCFNVPYLKQNTKMFFPSYLFFTKQPKNVRYEIRSKHSPNVYVGTLEFENCVEE